VESRKHVVCLLPGPHDAADQCAMPAVRVPLQLSEVADQLRPQRIQMQVANELEQVGFVFTEDGPVPVLEDMAAPSMAAVELTRMASHESMHGAGETRPSRSKKQVEVVRNESPGIEQNSAPLDHPTQASHESVPVGVVSEDARPLDAPGHYVMENTGRVESWASWHGPAERLESHEDARQASWAGEEYPSQESKRRSRSSRRAPAFPLPLPRAAGPRTTAVASRGSYLLSLATSPELPRRWRHPM
jgi:hypothetical protein